MRSERTTPARGKCVEVVTSARDGMRPAFKSCVLHTPAAPTTGRFDETPAGLARTWASPNEVIRGARQVTVRLIDGWPSADALLGAYERIALLT